MRRRPPRRFPLYALPAAAGCFILAGLPLLWVLGGMAGGLAQGDWADLFGPRAQGLFRNSLVVAGGAALLAAGLGVPLALALARTDVPWRRGWLALSILPLLVPLPLRGIAWVIFCLPEGPVNNALKALLRSAEPVLIAYGYPGCILILGLTTFPFVLWGTALGLWSSPRELEEDAALDAGPGRVLAQVSLRSAAGGILAGLSLAFAYALADFDVPILLTVNVYPVRVFESFGSRHDLAGAVRACLPLFLLLLLLAAAWWRWGAGIRFDRLAAGYREPAVHALGRWRGPVAALAGAAILLPLAVDFSLLLWRAGGGANYALALASARGEIGVGVGVAAAAAVTATALALGLAGFFHRRRLPRALAVALVAAFFIPAPVLGLALVRLWNRPWLMAVYDTPAILVIAAVVRFLPVAWLILRVALSHAPVEVEEQAALDGCGEGQRLLRIVIPGMWPSLAAALSLTFMLSLTEIGASALVVPPGGTTLALRLHSFMHYGPDVYVASLTLVLAGIVLLPALVVAMVLRSAAAGGR